jgi:hypothetical protein
MTQQPGQGAGPQYSPDGKWWWDGSRWTPVNQAPAGPPGGTAGAPGPAVRPRRRPVWPWIVGVVALLFLIVIIAALNSAGNSNRAATTATVAPTHAATAAPTAKQATPAAAGRDGSCSPQPCANDNYGWIVTVSNIRYGADGGQFEHPEAGNVFVLVDVTFTNKLDREQHANPTEFVLMDAAGVKHTWRPLIEGCPTWDPVNLTKGATLGPKCLSFEAAAGKPSPLTLVWTPTGFGGGYSMKLS